ncbi:MAG: hypothetical protein CME26_16000 [Gemmatimonadetes bacterium]|mgnify:CR=1 FL=1|nr:hypothetical protein [Gemmatimonadota bacterium]|tara:strand:+ start:5810 stop:6358 length:549 start_codon:yes stop_codon:yes gene_type:complete
MGMIFEDSFTDGLGEGWNWIREHDGYWRIADGGLEIRVEPGVKDTVRNALVRPAPPRPYAVEVTITNHTHPTTQYEQAGITLYNNGEPVFKEVKELIDGDLYIIPGKKPMPTDSVRLRLLVNSEGWEAQFRPEGSTSFETAASGELASENEDQVSLQCYNGPEEGEHWIRFEGFQITTGEQA